MQLPKNTVPESNYLAPFFAAASKSPADADTLTSASRSSGEGKFDDLFDGLKPASKSSTATTPSEIASLGLAVCPPTTAPAAEADVNSELSIDGTSSPSEAEGEGVVAGTPANGSAHHGRAIGHATREARAAVRTARELARENKLADRVENVPATPDAFSTPTPEVNQPNPHASEGAFRTPRFNGLPEAALEHRNAPGLPPGLARLVGMHSPTSAAPDTSTGEQDSGDQALNGEFVVPNATQSVDAEPVNGEVSAEIPAEEPAETGNESTNTGSATPAEADAGVESLANSSAQRETATTANAGHAFARDLRTTRSHYPSAEDPAAVELSGASTHERRPLSVELAHRLNSVSAKRPFPDVSPMAARIAAALDGEAGGTNDDAVRSFVSADGEGLAKSQTFVGTDVANQDADMFSRFLPTSAQNAAPDYSAAAVGALENAPDAAHSSETMPVEVVNTAHEAVEVVLKTVDHASSQEQKSVNLRFSVGDLDLSVRVELHASQVRTTFRTDSAELRAALSQEWEALTSSQPGERTLKLVPAFVTASEQSSLNSFSGDASSRQRDSRADRETNERTMRVTAKSHGPAVAAPVASLHAAHATSAPLTSRRLHTVA